ncbi:unnamed protein product, partial [Prorocentrum cordatum]
VDQPRGGAGAGPGHAQLWRRRRRQQPRLPRGLGFVGPRPQEGGVAEKEVCRGPRQLHDGAQLCYARSARLHRGLHVEKRQLERVPCRPRRRGGGRRQRGRGPPHRGLRRAARGAQRRGGGRTGRHR